MIRVICIVRGALYNTQEKEYEAIGHSNWCTLVLTLQHDVE